MREVFVESREKQIRVAVKQNGELVQCIVEEETSKPQIGEIYKGRIKNIVPAINSIFVDIGLEKEAYMYYSDELKRMNIKKGQDILIEVVKEPLCDKGAKVTHKISIAGKNLVLIMGDEGLSLSKRIEDVIEVSADNLEDLKKDAQNVDIDTLMYYIRVLSELSNDLKFSTQKRVKTEITFIKLMRPAMDNSQDIGDVVSRVTMLEGQLQKVLDDIKSGRLVNAGAAGGQAAVQQQTPKKPVVKRVYDAVPEDVKAIAAGWKDIIATIDDPVNQTFLQAAHVTLAEDGISLEIMVESLSAYNSLSRQEVMESIENVIEERTGVRVSIKVTKLNDDEDFHSRFVDLKELVGIDIEVDDKEEYI